jgi:hypothetical protein
MGSFRSFKEELSAGNSMSCSRRPLKACLLKDSLHKLQERYLKGINGNIKTLLRRGRGYRNLCYLLLKPRRPAVTRTEFVAFEKAA